MLAAIVGLCPRLGARQTNEDDAAFDVVGSPELAFQSADPVTVKVTSSRTPTVLRVRWFWCKAWPAA